MFKRPFKVEVDAQNVNVEHEISLSWLATVRLERLVRQTTLSAIAVIGVAAVAKTSSEIAIHIAKTKI